MKKYYSLCMLAIAAMAAFSCAKAVEEAKEPEKSFEPKVISAFTDDDVTPDTKTSLSGVNILWASTDNIKGYDGADVHTSTSTAISEVGKMAAFTFETVSVEDDLYYLAYPAENVSDIDKDYVYATIPSVQVATANSFANGANVAIADGLVANPAFKNVGGLLSIIINNDDVTSVKLSANEELTGSSIISTGSGDFAEAVIDEGVKSVTLSGTIANGTEYYAVVYPGTYTGLKIEVTNTSGQIATYTNPNSLTVARNANLHIATLTIPDGKWVTPTKGSEYIWTLASGDLGSNGSPSAAISGKGTPAKNWSATYTFADATKYIGWESARGVQFGSGSHACNNATFSTTDYSEFIQSVAINAAATGTGSIAVSVNGVSLRYSSATSQSLSNSATEYVFIADALIKGAVEVIFSGGSKAFYLKSIKINPDLREEQSLSFPQAAYSVELTESIFADPGLSGASTTVTYTSSDTDVATVNPSTGLVSLVSVGTTTITATAAADEDYQEGVASYTLTVNPGPSSIAAVIAASDDESVYTSGVVAQVNAKGFIITDGTDNILVYQNATPSVVEGQLVKVSGTRGTYNNVPQIASPVITKGATGQDVARTSKTTITSSNCTGITSSSYIELCGTLTISGSYYNIAIDGSSVKGSLYQVVPATTYSGTTLSEMDGCVVNVTGYVTGSSASYLNIAPVDVKYLGYESPSNAGYADDSSIDIDINANCSWTAAKGTDANNIIKSVTYNSTTVTVTFNANAGDEKTAQVVLTPDAETGLPAIHVTVTQNAYGTSLPTKVNDVLNLTFTGVSGTSYTEWTGKTGTSGAVYAGQCAGGNSSIQLRSNNSNSGIVTTTSGGKVKKIVVAWNSNTDNARVLNIYGKASAYTDATDLYNNTKQGDLLGTIAKNGGTELTISGDYEYIGLRSSSGAMYIDSITITWEN